MVQALYDKDVDFSVLKDKKIAIIGYGSQGHAHALNLKDSGCQVVVGLHSTSKSIAKAQAEGLEVMSPAEAAKASNLIMLLVPDEFAADIYEKDIAPNLNTGDTLAFAHGFHIHFKSIVPPKDVNIILIAPKGPGHMVRRVYQEGFGVPCIWAVEQDATNNATAITQAYAKGVGGTRAGIIKTSFKEETETDLFGEQVVLCGGTTALVQAGFETLVEAGYQPEIAYFECLHELKLIVDLMYEGGIAKMRDSISNTAEYGDLTVGPKIITPEVKKNMSHALDRIKSGEFAKEFLAECKAGKPQMEKLRLAGKENTIEKVGGELRNLMAWIKE
ncbi:MAG: ketol-acid reductoisomerase [Bacteriovoracaceae bacterium]|nr:ketol-acid reductoisomerase [Bacteriovoracaceae bacterium]